MRWTGRRTLRAMSRPIARARTTATVIARSERAGRLIRVARLPAAAAAAADAADVAAAAESTIVTSSLFISAMGACIEACTCA